MPWVERVYPVETAQQGRFATARRTDKGGDLVLRNSEVDVEKRLRLSVMEIQSTQRNLGGLFLLLRIRSWRIGLLRYCIWLIQLVQVDLDDGFFHSQADTLC